MAESDQIDVTFRSLDEDVTRKVEESKTIITQVTSHGRSSYNGTLNVLARLGYERLQEILEEQEQLKNEARENQRHADKLKKTLQEKAEFN